MDLSTAIRAIDSWVVGAAGGSMARLGRRRVAEVGPRSAHVAGLPYAWGGGHAHSIDRGYDCSGAASYVLQATGRLDGAMPSAAFRRYGESGAGEWISLYARRDHVFLVVAGLRFDTGYGGGAKGPQWTTRSRPADGSVLRHPPGL